MGLHLRPAATPAYDSVRGLTRAQLRQLPDAALEALELEREQGLRSS